MYRKVSKVVDDLVALRRSGSPLIKPDELIAKRYELMEELEGSLIALVHDFVLHMKEAGEL